MKCNNFWCNCTITEIDPSVYPKLLGDQSYKLKTYGKPSLPKCCWIWYTLMQIYIKHFKIPIFYFLHLKFISHFGCYMFQTGYYIPFGRLVSTCSSAKITTKWARIHIQCNSTLWRDGVGELNEYQKKIHRNLGLWPNQVVNKLKFHFHLSKVI